MLVKPEDVESARRDYFERRLMPSGVRHAVLRSWQRCSEMGLRAHMDPNPDPLPQERLAPIVERNEELLRLCRPELEVLQAEARDSMSIVLLADADGLILESHGDRGFAQRAASVSLAPGAQWTESMTGTNAIGVALTERRPAVVHGREHFFQGHGDLSCAASPIVDPRGAILGVLDLSGPAQIAHTHAPGLVRLAVDQIEHRLFRQAFDGCRILRFHHDRLMLGSAREGILAFQEGQLVAANRHGLSLIGRGWDVLDVTRIDDLFETTPDRAGEVARIRQQEKLGREGTLFFAVWDYPAGGHSMTFAGTVRATDPRDRSLEDVESSVIRQTLALCDNNVSAAARRLGIHRSTIYRKLRGA